jgi:peptidoglycan L-alanyl-D-glutamate endopeptidase CwlK
MAWRGKAQARVGDAIVSPAVDAGGNPANDTIATLTEWFPKEGESDNHPVFDAAIAKLKMPVSEALKKRFGVPSVISKTIVNGMEVQYSGARSGALRSAKVTDAHMTSVFTLEGATGGPNQFTFIDLVQCDSGCDDGDSGSAVYRAGNPPLLLGLLMAGSATTTVFCRIEYIFSMLGIDVAKAAAPGPGGGPGGPPPAGGQPPAGGPNGGAQPPAGGVPPGGGAPPGDIGRVTVDVVVQAFNNPGIRASVTQHLPRILAAMRRRNLTDRAMLAVCLGTIRAETASFEPVTEGVSSGNSSDGTFRTAFDRYDNKTDLGNKGKPDGMRFRGRGFVQLTGRANYDTFGARIGLGAQLLERPDLANDPDNAANLLAAFLADRENRIRNALAANDLDEVRRAVNGGTNGVEEFKTVYHRAIALI